MKFYLKLLLVITCSGGSVHHLFAQPASAVYADKQTNGGSAAGSGATGSFLVSNPDDARNTASNVKPNSKFALLTASSTLGTSNAWIQLEFPADIAATTGAPVTVYVRTNNNTTALLGGGVELSAYDKNGSQVSVQSAAYRTYYTPDGAVFLAITPTATFKQVRVRLYSPAAFGTNTLQVYYAFYGLTATNTSNPYPFNVADCGSPNVSTKDYSGLTVGSFDVLNAGNAIDSDVSSKSSFVSTGISLFSGHIKQTFFFNGVSNNADAVRVVLSQSGSFLAANLSASLTLQGYNGSTAVGTAVLASALLDADLLGLLGGNNNQTSFYFAPKDGSGNSVIFDRVEVDLNIGTLGVGLGSNGVHIHDVRRSPDTPTASGPKACSNVGIAALAAVAPQSGISGIGSFSYTWYTTAHGSSSVSTYQNWTASGLNTPGTASYYVEITKSGTGCIASPRKKVDINVSSPPTSPGVALTP